MFPMGGPEVPSSVSLRTIAAVTAPPPTHRAAPAAQHHPLTPTRAQLTSVREDNAEERGASPLNTPAPQWEAGDQNAGDRLLCLAGSERDTGWTGKPARQPDNPASGCPCRRGPGPLPMPHTSLHSTPAIRKPRGFPGPFEAAFTVHQVHLQHKHLNRPAVPPSIIIILHEVRTFGGNKSL